MRRQAMAIDAFARLGPEMAGDQTERRCGSMCTRLSGQVLQIGRCDRSLGSQVTGPGDSGSHPRSSRGPTPCWPSCRRTALDGAMIEVEEALRLASHLAGRIHHSIDSRSRWSFGARPSRLTISKAVCCAEGSQQSPTGSKVPAIGEDFVSVCPDIKISGVYLAALSGAEIT
jgi:hypothetical protein